MRNRVEQFESMPCREVKDLIKGEVERSHASAEPVSLWTKCCLSSICEKPEQGQVTSHCGKCFKTDNGNSSCRHTDPAIIHLGRTVWQARKVHRSAEKNKKQNVSSSSPL